MSDHPVGARPKGAGLSGVAGAIGDVWRSMRRHRLGWAAPVVVVLLLVAALLALIALVPGIAPFVYPLL